MLQIKREQLKNISDEEIIEKVKDGFKEYYSEIVRRYNQRLYRIALGFGIYDDDCEEVMQLAYILAYEKIEQFRGESRFSTWLIRILINECLMMKRKKKRFLDMLKENFVTISSSDHLNPEKKYMDTERKEILEKAVIQLPEKYKSVYILKEIEGLNVEEVSAALNITKVNVKVRTHRAKSILKDLLMGITDVSNLFAFGNERCDQINDIIMEYVKNRIN